MRVEGTVSERLAGGLDKGLGFGPFVLFPSRRLLLEDGRPVDLGDRALDILAALASRPGKIVSKQTLLAEAWPDVFVEEVNLRVHVSAVRRALGDGVGGRRFLKTIPGQGYSFVAPVVSLARANPEPVATAPWLPQRTRKVFGRDAVITSVVEDLAHERLITLAGPAGIGKTTVAIAAADRAQSRFPDGGAFVDLAPVSDPATLPIMLAMALGLTQLRVTTVENVAAALRGRRILLVVDNCEHLIGAVAEALDVLLPRTDGVRVIATSREPILIPGEKLRRMPPLELPDVGKVLTAKQARANPAIQLFEQQARAARDSFELDDASAPVLADICRRLDGVPFAIELAASRVDMFGIAELKAQIDDRMSLLDYSGGRVAPPHQRSVRDALAWSYDLLSEHEQKLLRRLSVFAWSFSLEDAIALVAVGETKPEAVIDGVAALTCKSLLAVEFRGLEAKYRLLETTRIFALERFSQDDTPSLWRGRHAELIQARLEEAEANPSAVISPGLPAAARYLGDLRVALDWASSDPTEAVTAANLTLAAVPLWTQLSLQGECRRRIEAALKNVRGGSEEQHRDMRLHAALGQAILYGEGPAPAAATALSQALEAARRLGDVDHELRALWGLYSRELNTGGYRRALDHAHQFTQAAERSMFGDDALIGERMLGAANFHLGNPRLAKQHTEAMLNRYIPPTDGRDIRRYQHEQRIVAQGLLGPVLWMLGLPDQAQVLSDRNLGEARLLDHPLSLMYAVSWHGYQAICLAGDAETGREDLRCLSELAERFPWSPAPNLVATLSGSLEARFGDPALGVTRLEAAFHQRSRTGHLLKQANLIGLQAVAWRRAGDMSRALAASDAAIEVSQRYDELWCRPELMRIKGEVVRDMGEISRAQELFEAAIQQAQTSGARGWELRAATDLGQLWIGLGKREAARALLGKICDQFSEGFETSDLKAALGRLRDLG
jgi:predicted ATPase/DNA-binding winged helix-turn-helix (wHTH) protein